MSDNNPTIGEVRDEKQRRSFAKYGCIVILLLFAGIVVLLVAAVQEARYDVKRLQCMSYQKGLCCALHNYHGVHETLPPAYSTDTEGKPLHSWRVLILPLMEQQDLYDQIRLDEPWDSEYNSQFHHKMPRFYYCPCRPIEEQKKGLTPYQMIIGPDTMSNGPNSTKLSDITRYTDDTILFVEASVSVPWMKPEDLPQSALQNGVVSSVAGRDKPVVQAIGSPHYDNHGYLWFGKKATIANVTMIDTAHRYFTPDISPEELLKKSRIREPESLENNSP